MAAAASLGETKLLPISDCNRCISSTRSRTCDSSPDSSSRRPPSPGSFFSQSICWSVTADNVRDISKGVTVPEADFVSGVNGVLGAAESGCEHCGLESTGTLCRRWHIPSSDDPLATEPNGPLFDDVPCRSCQPAGRAGGDASASSSMSEPTPDRGAWSEVDRRRRRRERRSRTSSARDVAAWKGSAGD